MSLWRWHRPLMVLAGTSILVLAGCVVGLVVDGRTLTGAPIWLKPAKFAISIAIYAFTLAWLITQLQRRRRLASVLGTVIAVMLAGELVAIIAQVVRGRTSHFDFATPLDAAVYQAMAVMIGTVWLANLAIAALLMLQRMPDRATAWALRVGMLIAITGMALAFLMTLPTTAQRQSWTHGAPVTVIGAHTVGLPDGGPGLPIIGWSTVGGDLRIPHFVGLHGLQVMILLALALTWLGQRRRELADQLTRLRIVTITALAYLALLAVLTWQALRGQSVVHPDALTLTALALLLAAAVLGYAWALLPRSVATSV